MRALLSSIIVFLTVVAAMGSGDIFSYKYFIDDFPNGLRMVTVPTDYPNLVAFWVVMQVGSRNEVELGKSGFAHFFEHMMFRGTENYSSARYDELLKNAGADGNAFTTDDYTAYHTTLAKDDLDLIFKLEADRFQNLKYSQEDFRTEAKAILGEYNKDSSDPVEKMLEVLRDRAYDVHTYKHTTMGFIKDIEDMPNQFDYSRQFFARFYRPEYATILVVGDVNHDAALALARKYWGNWERGSYQLQVPEEPVQKEPRAEHVTWPSATLPWVLVAYKGPAYSDETKDMPTADIVSNIAFSETSDLYQKLVIKEQKVDALFPMFPDHRDSYLLSVAARVKNVGDVNYVKDAILQTFESLKTASLPRQQLENVKSNLKYSLALRMDNSEAIAEILANYIQLRRSPASLNKLYRIYGAVTAEDVKATALKYFTTERRTIVTLGYGGE